MLRKLLLTAGVGALVAIAIGGASFASASGEGTRFTHAHGDELERQAERMEAYYELVVEGLRAAGYRWYETANFCRPGRESRHNLGYWQGADYLGAGIGGISTLGRERRATGRRCRGIWRRSRPAPRRRRRSSGCRLPSAPSSG